MAEQLVFGHTNPDTDTIASAISLSYLINAITKDDNKTEAVALGEVNDETAFALNYFKTDAPRVITRVDDQEVYLVDHNEAVQSVSNIAELTVAGVVDHHKINFETSAPTYFLAQPLGSASTIIYGLYKQFDVEIPTNIAGLMASAIISDTLLLKSPTTTDTDKHALLELAQLAQINPVDGYGMDMLKAGTDLSKKTDKELIDGDAKSFEMAGRTIRIGQVNTVDIDSVLERKEALVAAMVEEMTDNSYDDFLFVITDIVNSNSKAIFVGEDLGFVEEAFDEKISDRIIDLPGVVSRKKQVVPPLQEVFK
jgi:manganese-dependent inorganic pyrophosphatase